MGTYFPKSKCADLGRSLRKGASTTCLQTLSASTSGPGPESEPSPWLCVALPLALSISIFCVASQLLLASCLAWQWTRPAPGPGPPPPRFPPEVSAPHALFALHCFAKYSSLIFYLCLRKFWDGKLSCPQAWAGTISDQSRPEREALGRPTTERSRTVCWWPWTFSLCHTQKSSVELLGLSHGYSGDGKEIPFQVPEKGKTQLTKQKAVGQAYVCRKMIKLNSTYFKM